MPAGKKRRTKAHVRADVALKYVQWICARAGFTTSDAPQGAYYGIDLSMQTFDRAGEVESEEVRFQVKAVSRLRFVKAGSEIAYGDLTSGFDKPEAAHGLYLESYFFTFNFTGTIKRLH